MKGQTSTNWCTLAATHGALLFFVEHRYYGQSRMTYVERTDADFQWLNAKQSTEDFKVFIDYIKTTRTQFKTAKWAAMGAGYAGNLAVWLRQRYPQTVNFVVASSPPLQAKYDFTEMLDGVIEAIREISSNCASSVSQGFNQVAQLMKTAQGRQSIKNTFNLCTDIDPTDLDSQQYTWSTIINPYTSMVLYGMNNQGPYRTQLTISKGICQFHTNMSISVMTRMQATFSNFNNAFGFGSFCTDIDYNGFVGYLANATDPYSDETRAWIWQQCTELGYFITTDSSTSAQFFSPSLPLSYYTKICQTIFGQQYDANYGSRGVDNVNTQFGGNMINASYTIILNGDHDPWRRLSIIQPSQNTMVPVIIGGMGYRSDIYPAASDDPASLKQARATNTFLPGNTVASPPESSLSSQSELLPSSASERVVDQSLEEKLEPSIQPTEKPFEEKSIITEEIQSCPSSWTKFSSNYGFEKCFKMISGDFDFFGAKMECRRDEDGSIATIGTIEEYLFLKKLASSGRTVYLEDIPYIGLIRDDVVGQLRWEDGETEGFVKFYNNQEPSFEEGSCFKFVTDQVIAEGYLLHAGQVGYYKAVDCLHESKSVLCQIILS